MWRELEADALYIGLDLEYFWRIDPKRFSKHIKNYAKKERERHEEINISHHLLGGYMRMAFGSEKYPDKPLELKKVNEIKKESMRVSDMERMARLNTMALGGIISKGGKQNDS